MAYCPNCGTKIEEDRKFCPGCGKANALPRKPIAPVSQPQPADGEDTDTHCSNCGEKLNRGVIFCSRCGAKQNESRGTKTFCSECGTEIADGVRFCPICGKSVYSTAMGIVNTRNRERHGFTSFWLILSLIFNIIAAATYFFYPEWMAEYSGTSSGLMMLSGFLLIIGSIECILLLCWKKIGFWILIGNSVISMIINLVDGENIGMVLFGLVSILIWWAILQIRKNGRSTWEQLE